MSQCTVCFEGDGAGPEFCVMYDQGNSPSAKGILLSDYCSFKMHLSLPIVFCFVLHTNTAVFIYLCPLPSRYVFQTCLCGLYTAHLRQCLLAVLASDQGMQVCTCSPATF